MKILKMTSLEKGYYDVDTLMLHANFQLLVDYVEKEDALNFIDWSDNKKSRAIEKEIKYLYNWWKTERFKRDEITENFMSNIKCAKPKKSEWFRPSKSFKGCSELVNLRDKYPEYFKAVDTYMKMQDNNYEEDTLNLIRLIKIRGYLWT